MSLFFDHYNIDPVKVSGFEHAISLKIIPGDAEKFKFDVSSLRAAFLKMLCLGILYKEEEANKNDQSTIRLGGNAINDEHKSESFLILKRFFFEWSRFLLLD